MYTGADLQNVCREAALVALRTRILGPSSSSSFLASKSTMEDVSPNQEPVVSITFEGACADDPLFVSRLLTAFAYYFLSS